MPSVLGASEGWRARGSVRSPCASIVERQLRSSFGSGILTHGFILVPGDSCGQNLGMPIVSFACILFSVWLYLYQQASVIHSLGAFWGDQYYRSA